MSRFSLAGQVAMITGAASGIGAATARAFAEAGADLVLGWYGPDGHDIEPVRRDVEAAGVTVILGDVDVRHQCEIDGLANEAIRRYGRIDVVVANAGIARREPAVEGTTDETWDQVLDVNLAGSWRTFKAAIPVMRANGYGRLLATTSVSGPVRAWTEHTAYAASKAGIVGMVKTMAVELGPAGITVNAVAPGLVTSPQSLDPVNSLGPAAIARQSALIPVRRVGTPEDIASAFLYLASREASYVNGHVLVVDGGRWLAGAT
jgi:3-oxoacyl-[acyl-carrier protein] reductase